MGCKMKKRLLICVTVLLFFSAVIVLLGTYGLFSYHTQRFIIAEMALVMITFTVLIITINLFISKYLSKRNKNYEMNKKILESIIEISDSILTVKKIEELFQLILKRVVQIIDDAEMGSLMILKDNHLEFKAVVGFDYEKIKSIKLNLEDTFLYRMGKGKIQHACIIRGIEKFNKEVFDEKLYQSFNESNFFITKSAVSAPILINGVLYGMINVDSTRKDAFVEADLLLMEYFASQVGTVIRNHQLVDKLMYLSQYDKLTGVYNRSYFEELLNHRLAAIQKECGTFTIAIFDLNNLKVANDTYGHQIGDVLIKNFADTLKRHMDEGDLFARYGGDEFIAVYFNQSKAQVNEKINQLIKGFRKEPLRIGKETLHIEFSFGTALYPQDSRDIDKIISIADNTMYCHKQQTKGLDKCQI